jgi:hypothetical protein
VMLHSRISPPIEQSALYCSSANTADDIAVLDVRIAAR